MISTHQFHKLPRRCHLRQGFTLLELMMVLACSSIILAGILTSYIYLIRGFSAVANYTDIHQQAGYAVAIFTKDMREVSNVGSCTPTYLQVTVPTNFTASGTVAGSKTITYAFTSNALWRTDSSGGGQKIQAASVSNAVFTLYGTNGVALATNTVAGAKGVQMDLVLCKYIGNQANSEEFRSARVCMRNTP